MKTTHNWIKDYCPHSLSPEQLVERLTVSGLEIEGLHAVGDDFLIEAEVTSNRPDLLGAIGIARDVGAVTGVKLNLPPVKAPQGKRPVDRLAHVEVLDACLCPRYTARVITGAKVGPSPAWLVKRLESIGFRSINNIVDITNFVLMECGQPLHAFDLDRLEGQEIIVRRATRGEAITTIDGRQRTLGEEMLVIADARRPVAVAGVMGGVDAEVSEATTDILIESAQFRGPNIRATSRALGLASDSSYRFERGVDPRGVDWASRRAADLILEFAGGELAHGVIDVWPEPYRPVVVPLRLANVNRLLGTDLSNERVREILTTLDFEIAKGDDEDLTVVVPSFRADVTREIDLIEEVARIHGYDHIPARSTIRVATTAPSRADRVHDELLYLLSGCGYHETVSNSFTTEANAALVSPWTAAPAVRFTNVVRQEEGWLRRTILPNLLRIKETNTAHGVLKSELFEIARVYLDEGAPQPREQRCLAILEEDDLLDLKGTLEVVVERFGLAERCRFEPWEDIFFAPGMAGKMLLDDQLLAVMGRVADGVADRFSLRNAPCVAEMNTDVLTDEARLDVHFAPLPTFPGALRDLAAVVAEAVTWAQIKRCVRAAGGKYLAAVDFFDLYRGKQVPAGSKSVAFSMVFRSPERTLTNDEVDGYVATIVAALERDLGATLRKG